MNDPLFWLTCNLLTIVTLAFYSMVEMACVSLNKSRLHFYAVNGNWRAQMLEQLLNNPSELFTTTLIGVNVATVVGSECAREFNSSIGISPDLAPISQVILVVILGELAPMFAARKFSEQVAMLGAPLLYFSAKILLPFTWAISWMTNLIDKLLGGHAGSHELFIGKDELLKMVEGQDFVPAETGESQELTNVAASLFTLHTLKLEKLMIPLSSLHMLPADATIVQLRNLMKKSVQSYVPLYHRRNTNIVGILHIRDILRAPDNHRVGEYAHTPWFVTQHISVAEVIQQFRTNNQRMAVILNKEGKAEGVVTFTGLINEVFGVSADKAIIARGDAKKTALLLDKTLPASTTVEDFEKKYGVKLADDPNKTIADLIKEILGGHPNVGDSVIIGHYSITVKKMTIMGIRNVVISSLSATQL